ncbi:hypothetical protein [Hymenobacter segetis]|uniref:Transcriptional regulator n=1 Tax=Hymenobacter segetis TaxID=2025509 RepID=A0ABU9LWA5_9BACT
MAQPEGRDLATEVNHLKAWLLTMPAINASTISVAAGLLRGDLGNVLRGNRSPQAHKLDAIYKVLVPYGYKNISPDNKNI